MNRIFSTIDYRIMDSIVHNVGKPNSKKHALRQDPVINAKHPNIQDLQNRGVEASSEMQNLRNKNSQLKDDNNRLRVERDQADVEKQNLQNRIIQLQQDLNNRCHFNNVSIDRIDNFKILANPRQQYHIYSEHLEITANAANLRQQNVISNAGRVEILRNEVRKLDASVNYNTINDPSVIFELNLPGSHVYPDSDRNNDIINVVRSESNNSAASQKVENNNADNDKQGDDSVKSALMKLKGLLEDKKNLEGKALKAYAVETAKGLLPKEVNDEYLSTKIESIRTILNNKKNRNKNGVGSLKGKFVEEILKTINEIIRE